MKRYYIVILTFLLLVVSGLALGCGHSISYYNPEFGYSVEMPNDWEVVEEPVNTFLKKEQNTVGFRPKSWDESQNLMFSTPKPVPWLRVQVTQGGSAYGAFYNRPQREGKFHQQEYGKGNYLVESEPYSDPGERRFTTYYIEENNNLYTIMFCEGAESKIWVSVDNYGRVNH